VPSVATLPRSDQAQSERNDTSDMCSSSAHVSGHVSNIQGGIVSIMHTLHHLYILSVVCIPRNSLVLSSLNHESTTP
jgi:hypothetical protein